MNVVNRLVHLKFVFFFFLFRYETEVFSEWTQGVDEVAKANLDKPLIVRDPDTLSISVNFDPKVCWFKAIANMKLAPHKLSTKSH